jgi:hypothetical protein
MQQIELRQFQRFFGNAEIGYLVGLTARVETYLHRSRSGQNLSVTYQSVNQKNRKPTSHFFA